MVREKKQRYSLNKNKYLLEPEKVELERVLRNFEDTNPRDCTLLWMALLTGARAQEALNIKKQDLNEHEKSVFIIGIKGSNDREIPVPPWLFKKLMQIKPAADGRLFPISYNRFRQIWDLYRPIKKKLHSLRHTFAINLYQKTKDLRLVQVALGHRNITNTMIYADYSYSQTELRKLIL